MKQQITVDGVVLTREQLEKALDEINEPEPVEVQGGELIYERGLSKVLTWIVVAPSMLSFQRDDPKNLVVVSPRDGSLLEMRPQDAVVLIRGYEKKVVEGLE